MNEAYAYNITSDEEQRNQRKEERKQKKEERKQRKQQVRLFLCSI